MAYGCEKTRRAAMIVRYAGVGELARASSVATNSSVEAGSADGAIMQQAPRHVHWCCAGGVSLDCASLFGIA